MFLKKILRRNCFSFNHCDFSLFETRFRKYSEDVCETGTEKKGLIIGAYDGCIQGQLELTSVGRKIDEQVGGYISDALKGSELKFGKTVILNDMAGFHAICVAGLGMENAGFDEKEFINVCKENIRSAMGLGTKLLQNNGVQNIYVEGVTNAEAAAEGANLAIFKYEEYKAIEARSTSSKVFPYDVLDKDGWDRGVHKAGAQNIARWLEETPANIMTPTGFAQKALEILCPCGVKVEVRDKKWLEDKKFTAMLMMFRRSGNQPLFLEISFCGGQQEDKPVVLVGKGVTFDNGDSSLSLEKCKDMSERKADMAGAAVIVGTVKALASLSVPINVNGLIPLCENAIIPGGMAVRPGNIVQALNGKTIRITNTDNIGQVLLSDALCHAVNYKPCLVINVATLTTDVKKALGPVATGCFTTSDIVWQELSLAAADTGDRVWRLPLWSGYTDIIKQYDSYDVDNVGDESLGGGPCTAAAFLKEFAPAVDFAALDITGTGMKCRRESPPYYRKGFMTGRPTRTLIEFLSRMACPVVKGPEF